MVVSGLWPKEYSNPSRPSFPGVSVLRAEMRPDLSSAGIWRKSSVSGNLLNFVTTPLQKPLTECRKVYNCFRLFKGIVFIFILCISMKLFWEQERKNLSCWGLVLLCLWLLVLLLLQLSGQLKITHGSRSFTLLLLQGHRHQIVLDDTSKHSLNRS